MNDDEDEIRRIGTSGKRAQSQTRSQQSVDDSSGNGSIGRGRGGSLRRDLKKISNSNKSVRSNQDQISSQKNRGRDNILSRNSSAFKSKRSSALSSKSIIERIIGNQPLLDDEDGFGSENGKKPDKKSQQSGQNNIFGINNSVSGEEDHSQAASRTTIVNDDDESHLVQKNYQIVKPENRNEFMMKYKGKLGREELHKLSNSDLVMLNEYFYILRDQVYTK